MDPRVEKMVQPLRKADRRAEERYQQSIAGYKADVAQRRRDAMLVRDILESNAYIVTLRGETLFLKLSDRVVRLKVMGQ